MVQQSQPQQQQQQPTPSPQQQGPMSNQSQGQPLTPMGYGEGAPSPSVAPQTPNSDQQQVFAVKDIFFRNDQKSLLGCQGLATCLVNKNAAFQDQEI